MPRSAGHLQRCGTEWEEDANLPPARSRCKHQFGTADPAACASHLTTSCAFNVTQRDISDQLTHLKCSTMRLCQPRHACRKLAAAPRLADYQSSTVISAHLRKYLSCKATVSWPLQRCGTEWEEDLSLPPANSTYKRQCRTADPAACASQLSTSCALNMTQQGRSDQLT
jgi:hypothetical protein